MICYLVRHGKDDDNVRGGWSSTPLSCKGAAQANQLVSEIISAGGLDIGTIYTSDLPRAKQTADILSDALNIPVRETPEFRETNNGILAGMDNAMASELYPGLYWNTLDWEQRYPGGESPCEFYHRIADAWYTFKQEIRNKDHSVILVTHGGVISVIRCIEDGTAYSNKTNPYSIGNAQMVSIEI